MNVVVPPLVACAAAIVTAVAAVAGAVIVRGSTAVPAALWAAAAAAALACETGCRAAGWLVDPAASTAARLCVVALGLCPTMSLLGAKRPQHGVWQFIVAALALVLVMPAATAALVRPGTMPDIHLLERGLMLVVAVVGWLNFVGTRRAAAASLVAVGQLILMGPLLPFARAAVPGVAVDAVAAVAIAWGALVAARPWGGPRRAPTSVAGGLASRFAGPFFALRETLGAAWTLRIAERFNAIATNRGWPARLHFRGLETGGDPADTTWHRDAARAFEALLRRFVTPAWLQRHGWPRHTPDRWPPPA